MSKENGSYNKTEGSAHHSIFSQKGQTALTHILHLSDLHFADLHFGTESDAILWSNQLAIDLRQELGCNQVDAMIISGDVANIAVESEYMAAPPKHRNDIFGAAPKPCPKPTTAANGRDSVPGYGGSWYSGRTSICGKAKP